MIEQARRDISSANAATQNTEALEGGVVKELLEALQVLIFLTEEPVRNPEVAAEAFSDARAAIAKAKGER